MKSACASTATPAIKSNPQVIYEVTLSLPEADYQRARSWLLEHIKDMLAQDGFLGADLWHADVLQGDNTLTRVTIHYTLATRQHLNGYLTQAATRMRAAGTSMLGEACHIDRRILSARQHWVAAVGD